jgi:uncharacterized protein (TIGR02271 family)
MRDEDERTYSTAGEPVEGDYEEEGHASTGGAAVAGAVTGGAIGLVGGPIGAAVGAAGGAILGALTERVMHGSEGHEHLEGDEEHFAGDHEHTDLDDGHDHKHHYDEYARGERHEAEDRAFQALTGAKTDTLQLREEELDVRTRRAQTGEVEVGKRVVEAERTLEVPVEREEVYVERRPVDRRPADDADFADDRETIRVPVMEEEVDVDKRAYVTEEIEVGKRVVQDTKTVSDTVRREEAVINREGNARVADSGAQSFGSSASWDEAMPRFRSRWQQRSGSTGGTWSSEEPRYRYGWEMANRPEYRGRSWDAAEPELRRDYESRYGDSAWDDVKDSVRDAWDSLTGSRR